MKMPQCEKGKIMSHATAQRRNVKAQVMGNMAMGSRSPDGALRAKSGLARHPRMCRTPRIFARQTASSGLRRTQLRNISLYVTIRYRKRCISIRSQRVPQPPREARRFLHMWHSGSGLALQYHRLVQHNPHPGGFSVRDRMQSAGHQCPMWLKCL